MYFQSMADFWAMGGHGFYVWLAYGISVIIFIYNVMIPIQQRNQLRRQIHHIQSKVQSK
jgi:heme exporter protein D